jgi:hypothetical protein
LPGLGHASIGLSPLKVKEDYTRRAWELICEFPREICFPIGYDGSMTTLLEQAFAKARDLSADKQDALARLMLEEIEAESKWDDLFARSPEKLRKLGDRAWAEHEAGKTCPLDPEKL